MTASATSSGERAVFVPITPCRLIDTRAGGDNVGVRSTPIDSGEAATFQVTGTNGDCLIPVTATGITANATAVNPSSSSYVTIYPADANPRPTASNLNVVAGAAPTPNQVTVGLSAAGAIGVYNNAGTVDLIIDIVGYYTDHDHDDRYYTKAQVDAAIAAAATGTNHDHDDRYYTKAQADAAIAAAVAGKANKPSGTQVLHIASFEFRPLNTVNNADIMYNNGDVRSVNANTFEVTAPIQLPNGATVTAVSARVADTEIGVDVSIAMSRTPYPFSSQALAQVSTTGAPGPATIIDTTIATPIIDNASFTYRLDVNGVTDGGHLYEASISYIIP
jgi:hypothetical protein